jgi:hypothetical protein
VRWAQRIERLLALASWRHQDYRRAAAWVAGCLPSATKEQGKSQERLAGAGAGLEREAGMARLSGIVSDKAKL